MGPFSVIFVVGASSVVKRSMTFATVDPSLKMELTSTRMIGAIVSRRFSPSVTFSVGILISQIPIVPSTDPVARTLPSAEIEIEITGARWPVSLLSIDPFSQLNTFNELSA